MKTLVALALLFQVSSAQAGFSIECVEDMLEVDGPKTLIALDHKAETKKFSLSVTTTSSGMAGGQTKVVQYGSFFNCEFNVQTLESLPPQYRLNSDVVCRQQFIEGSDMLMLKRGEDGEYTATLKRASSIGGSDVKTWIESFGIFGFQCRVK